jgi:hypothetical protein
MKSPCHQLSLPKGFFADLIEIPDEWVKLTVDGSFKLDEGTTGCGMVLRGADENIIVYACLFCLVVLKLLKQSCGLVKRAWS